MIFIQIEETPNPHSLKFIPGFPLLSEGQSAFLDRQAVATGLAKVLFEKLEAITHLFFAENFLSVTKEEDASWANLKPQIVALILDYKETALPFLELEEKNQEHLKLEDRAIVEQIKEVLETKVRPAVAQDGGDIAFHSYSDGVVYLEMQGACSGCPSAAITLKDGVENLLRYYVPEVIRVEQI
jgi:Fe-S cluster biogenesis protein NfuA